MDVNPVTTLSVAAQRLGRKIVFIFKRGDGPEHKQR